VLETRQRIQVGQLCDPVLGKDQCAQVRYARREVGLDVGDAVLREEERSKARLKWEVAELCDVVVGEVYGVVVLSPCQYSDPCSEDRCNLLALLPCSQSQKSCDLDYTILISTQLSSVASALFNAPRRSSSRSVRQLMKDRELLMRSVVNLMLAVVRVVYWG